MENEFKVGMLVIDSDGQVILVTNDNLRVINKYKSDFEIGSSETNWRSDFEAIPPNSEISLCNHKGLILTTSRPQKKSSSKLRKDYVAWRTDCVVKQVDHDGKIRYFKNGLRHREDGPALIWPNNAGLFWYQNDVLHREDGPAVVKITGETAEVKYYLHGKEVKNVFPVEDRDTFNIYNKHEEVWYKITIDRSISPVVIDGVSFYNYSEILYDQDCSVCYYKHGYLHNENGPAYSHCDGSAEYYLNGKWYLKGDWQIATGKIPELTLDEVEDRLGYKIKLKKDE